MQCNVLMYAMAICSASLLAHAAQAPPKAAQHHAVLSAAERAEAMTTQMGELMATSQQSLSQAEALYDKAVQKGKANFSQLLTTEAQAMAASIRTYTDSLANATAKLELSVNATRVSAAALTTKVGASFAEVENVATVSAKVESVASEARRMARTNRAAQDRAVQEAVDKFEEAQGMLSRKLGDISTMSEDARSIVQAAGPGDEGLSSSPAATVTPKPAAKSEAASLAVLNKNLVDAKAVAKADTAAAEKQVKAALKKAGAELVAGASKIKAALDDAQKEELDRVKHQKVDKEPPRHHFRHHRHRHS